MSVLTITIDSENLDNCQYLEEEANFAKQAKIAYAFTYGKGIDPSSVPDLLEALKYLVNTYSQNPVSWLSSNNPWGKAKSAIDKSVIKP